MTDIDAIVHRLDLDQKIAQLMGMSIFDLMDVQAAPKPGAMVALDMGKLAQVRPHGLGHVSMTWMVNHQLTGFTETLRELQERARALSPFGIGALVHGEGINGFLHAEAAAFPTAWGQAATWDPQLTRRVGAVAAAQMQRAGVHLAFSPVLDVSRDPRWGRVHETYGEDPELIAQLGVGFIRGVHGQAEDGPGVDGATAAGSGGTPASGVLATGKHFLGYAASEGGLNQATAQLGRRQIVDVHAEPFRRAIAEAGLRLVMNSYNDIDGVPSVADQWLLTDLLRGDLGFDGLVVSDYDAVKMLLEPYHTAATKGEAARQALSAGLDVELPDAHTFSFLREEVEAGRLSEQVVDQAVTRVLRIKDRLGLVPGTARAAATTTATATAEPAPTAPDAERLGLEIARKSIVLARNEGGSLPLAADVPALALVGPAADELRIHFGAYTGVANSEQGIAMGRIRAGKVPGIDPSRRHFTDIFQLRMPGIEPAFEDGVRRRYPAAPTLAEAVRGKAPHAVHLPFGDLAADAAPIDEEALAAALTGIDTVVAAVGERTGWVGNHTAGEGRTSARVSLPGNQEQLILALERLGKRVITVVVTGRPLVLERVAAASDALLIAPLLGQFAGEAVAEVLFGSVNPSGKLPSTFPRTLGQIPMYHGHPQGSGYDHPAGTRFGYTDLEENAPLFAFGHGLSYTSFSVHLDHVELIEDERLRISISVANTGDRAGETVAQVYARDQVASVVRPARQLLAFQRIALSAGQSTTITTEVPLSRLAYTTVEGRRLLEAGQVAIRAGSASDDLGPETVITVPEVKA